MVDQKRHPLLTALIAQGIVKLEGSEYVGQASDGVWVSLGDIYDTDRIERYLKDYPTPDRW